LTHNKIAIDHDAHTAIDKTTGFDLLNPKPLPPPPPPKNKLKQFFLDLQEDQKIMLAKLKMVCQERLLKIKRSFKELKPVDLIAAVRTRIEALTMQEQLNWLGEAVKEKYKDVFLPIPHLDELPTDVYC
jgi:hypothetical protein